MEITNEEHLRIVRDYEESKRKDAKLGQYTDVLIQLYVNDPDDFSAEFILKRLLIEHEKIGFEKIKE